MTETNPTLHALDVDTGEVMPATYAVAVASGIEVTPTSLVIPEGLSFNDWQQTGRTLGQAVESVKWWLGDWWRYGQRVYGDGIRNVEMTPFAYQTCRDAGWVAGAIELSLRSDKLSWSHHRVVASLEPAYASRLLAEAEAKNWSVAALVAAVRALKKQVKIAAIEPGPITTDIRHGDFLEVLDDLDGQIDAIITDPPYPAEFLPLYGDLAEMAGRLLRPGGICAVMVGQSYLPEIMERMKGPLTYHWTLAYLTPGGQSVQLWQRKVNTFWKPILLFTNGDYDGEWFGDVARSDVNDNDKNHHHWGQSESGMADLVERLTLPGQFVCDPFLGGGTTAVVCHDLGRRFVGCDIDESAVDATRARFA